MNRTFHPSRCEYCGGDRWIAFGEPCTACNASGKLRPWEDWPEPETPPWDSLADALRYGGSTGAPMQVRSARLGCILTVRDRRGWANDPWPSRRFMAAWLRAADRVPEPDDFPAIGPITVAVRGLDPEAWRP